MTGRVRQSGSVTVTLCLSVTMTAVLILGLAEAARFHGLKTDVKEWTNLAAESLAAEYQPYLLEEYELFFLDGSFGTAELNLAAGEAEMDALLAYNLILTEEKAGINLYHMQQAEAAVTGYILATDDSGKVFMSQTAKVMKSTIGQQVAKKILNRSQTIHSKEIEGGNPEQSIEDAGKKLQELAEQQTAEATANRKGVAGESSETAANTETKADTEPAAAENPLETIKPMRAQGILSLVLPEGKTISAKTISVDNCLLKRNCSEGTYHWQDNTGWYERILMQEFVKPAVGNFLIPKENAALSYGTEYLICGKSSDEENLKKTAEKLLLLREAVNFLYLQQDEGKKAEALTAAAVLAGASANPAVIELVQQGILAAWAYAESVCDVKALLSGGKVSLIKTSASWKTQLSKLGEAAAAESGGDSEGLSYQEYLDALLYTRTVKQIAYRSMDLMEKSLQNEEEYASCRMDHMIAGFQITAEYEAGTLFFGLMGDDISDLDGYQFVERTEYVYR